MGNRFIRFPELRKIVGLSRTTIWRLERQGDFPTRRKFGLNSVAWIEAEVEAWVNSKKKATEEK